MQPDASLYPVLASDPARAMAVPGRAAPPVACRPMPAAVPRWSLLALDRTADGSAFRARLRLERIARVACIPLGTGLAGIVAMAVLGSWVAGVSLATVAAVVSLSVLRLPVARRWHAEREAAQRTIEAARLRQELAARLLPEERRELESLEALVEGVRHRQAPARDGGGGSHGLVARLDGLLMLFVDLGLELRRVKVGFAATEGAPPKRGATEEPADPRSLAERDRCQRIAQLRVRARHRCRTRAEQLHGELTSIGQLVRLVHEQTLASNTSAADLARAVSEILDEAERVWQADEEVDALLAHGAT